MKAPFVLVVAVSAVGASPSAFAQGGALKSGGAELAMGQEVEAQAQEAARKGELADAILAARQTAAARDFGAGLRGSLKQSLMSLSVDRLEAFLAAGGLGDIEAAVRGPVVPKVLGDTAADLAFTPVAPCRIIDTRSAAAGILAAGTQRSFLVRNPGGFASQGGSATDCGIPGTATAVEMNFVAVSPAGGGDLRAFAFGGAFPNASVLNYSNVAGLNIANGIAQPVCNPAARTCTNDLTIQTDVSTTHLVVDVVGYFNKIDKTQVKSSVVLAHKEFTGAAPTANCSNAGDISVTITAPVAGRVLVQGLATVTFSHANGVGDEVDLFVGQTATDCPSTYGQFGIAAVFPPLPNATFIHSLPVFGVYDVTAGAHTFFLNSILVAGGCSPCEIRHGGLTATFMPN
jgi:hypothetical protein